MRIALGIEYDGTRFSGWERQRDRRTVQEAVERAIAEIADHSIKVVCAGRTDAGVHALGQVVHFDTHAKRRERGWLHGANSRLPGDINVVWCAQVEETFHARFSARSRSYRYLLYNQPTRSALRRVHAVWEYRWLDVERMQAGAGYLLGEHDFSSFRAAGCQAHHPVRTVYELSVKRSAAFVIINIRANAYLQHMVRNIAGVLIAIGQGEREPNWAQQVLRAKDRRRGGATARPQGLCLVGVDYPGEFALGGKVRTLAGTGDDVHDMI